MDRTKKIRLAIVLASTWLLIGVVSPILLCLLIQQPQIIWIVLLAVHLIVGITIVAALLLVKFIIWATEG